jgi:hypothetical protein
VSRAQYRFTAGSAFGFVFRPVLHRLIEHDERAFRAQVTAPLIEVALRFLGSLVMHYDRVLIASPVVGGDQLECLRFCHIISSFSFS